ncbi:hypothetical protein F511_28757 [Dorcoceras hygrometricum]|uniref:Uncharacterized protein n=1 Tax=Dorcoceras hygrometricum TaxID=472368 RepID=A0A2Z7CT64_9LAMI|nr:hypothetical protein F511_28757 [Dorcoceras hygrometricum]
MAQIPSPNSYISNLQNSVECKNTAMNIQFFLLCPIPRINLAAKLLSRRKSSVRCSGDQIQTLRTCKNCKTQFDPLLNHPRACRYHSAHFGDQSNCALYWCSVVERWFPHLPLFVAAVLIYRINHRNMAERKETFFSCDSLPTLPYLAGETKRKFESVYTGGTMDTPDSGKVFQYWHCCGSEDPFDPGCTAAPHASYDD